MLNRIHRTLKFLANTEGRGNVKPENIDFAIHNKVLEMQEELFFEINKHINRQNKGLVNGGLENIPDKIREKIQHYLEEKNETVTNGKFTIPNEVMYFDTVYYADTYIELSKNNKEFHLAKSEATLEYPIGIKISNEIKVIPETIDEVTISYVRKPLIAKWTYDEVDDVAMYSPSKPDFQDVDIHPSEETELILRVLQSFGFNLKEQDLMQLTEQIKGNEFNKEMAV